MLTVTVGWGLCRHFWALVVDCHCEHIFWCILVNIDSPYRTYAVNKSTFLVNIYQSRSGDYFRVAPEHTSRSAFNATPLPASVLFSLSRRKKMVRSHTRRKISSNIASPSVLIHILIRRLAPPRLLCVSRMNHLSDFNSYFRGKSSSVVDACFSSPGADGRSLAESASRRG